MFSFIPALEHELDTWHMSCAEGQADVVLALGKSPLTWMGTMMGRCWGKTERLPISLPPHLGAGCVLWRKQN